VRELAERLMEIPGVAAVTLGGSRAGGVIHPDSDWDFGLYYRGAIRADDARALGFEGTVVEPGAWGRLVNGGAWLTVADQGVDLLYRDLGVVQHWLDEAEAGRHEVDLVEGYVAGIASYVLAGELALAELLAGELPRPGFPDALRRPRPDAAPQRRLLARDRRHCGGAPRCGLVRGAARQGGHRGCARRARRVGAERGGNRPARRARRPGRGEQAHDSGAWPGTLRAPSGLSRARDSPL
jgi:hypothetical protein